MGIDAKMFVRTRQALTEEAVNLLAWEMAGAFGADKFWIFKPHHQSDYTRRAMAIIDKYEQDGDDILPERGEQFIEVEPATRYYGIGYERGNLPFLIMLAEWLELRIPGGKVWYGGDSSGVAAEPFGAPQRAALFEHFAQVGHLPYNGDPREKVNRFGEVPTFTAFCDFCKQPMRQDGFGGAGGGYGLFRCIGCGDETQTNDHGKTWTDPKGHPAQIEELERQIRYHREALAKMPATH